MSENETNNQAEEAAQPQQKTYTPEELAEMRETSIAFYTEELPFLRLREEYERLHADIEEHKTRKMVAQGKAAYMYQQAQEAEAAYIEELQRQKDAGDTPKSSTPAPSAAAAVPPTPQKRSLKID